MNTRPVEHGPGASSAPSARTIARVTTATVGICEDDDELRGVIRDALQREGFAVCATASGAEALRVFARDRPDVLVLDIGLPDADGRDVCQALRARGISMPVLFLTARDALTDRLSGFHAGGDDYLTKPFALAELLVRVQALRRRAHDARAAHDDPGVVLDPAAHAIVHRDARVALTPTEFRLLAALAARPGEVVRRATLIAAAWPDGAIVHDNTLDAYVTRIRRKLRAADSPATLTTTRGVGYVLR
ncbi:MAG: two-component system, OmpR family, response regulator [Solirubrobacteraceae bacterium]|nr:two-component system, OmpR family, response regulator [Solirubrobacteraceae bacterium]